MIIERPIKSIGRFFIRLPKAEQAKAIELSRVAGRLPKHVLDAAYLRFERIANSSNYL